MRVSVTNVPILHVQLYHTDPLHITPIGVCSVPYKIMIGPHMSKIRPAGFALSPRPFLSLCCSLSPFLSKFLTHRSYTQLKHLPIMLIISTRYNTGSSINNVLSLYLGLEFKFYLINKEHGAL